MSRLSIQELSEWSLILYLLMRLLHFTTAPTVLPVACVQQGHCKMMHQHLAALWNIDFIQRSLPYTAEIMKAECFTLDFKQIIIPRRIIPPTDNMGFETPLGLFYQHGLTSVSAWISYCISRKLCEQWSRENGRNVTCTMAHVWHCVFCGLKTLSQISFTKLK